jgi:hypothetical protein
MLDKINIVCNMIIENLCHARLNLSMYLFAYICNYVRINSCSCIILCGINYLKSLWT